MQRQQNQPLTLAAYLPYRPSSLTASQRLNQPRSLATVKEKGKVVNSNELTSAELAVPCAPPVSCCFSRSPAESGLSRYRFCCCSSRSRSGKRMQAVGASLLALDAVLLALLLAFIPLLLRRRVSTHSATETRG